MILQIFIRISYLQNHACCRPAPSQRQTTNPKLQTRPPQFQRRKIMSTVWSDVKYALRMLLKSRAYTAVAIFALTLGIGANTAIFSLVNTLLLRPLPYVDSRRLVMLE